MIAGVNNTGGQFAASVADTGGAPCIANNSLPGHRPKCKDPSPGPYPAQLGKEQGSAQPQQGSGQYSVFSINLLVKTCTKCNSYVVQ